MNSRRLITSQSVSFLKRKRSRLYILISVVVISLASWLFVFSRLSQLALFNIDVIEIIGADPDIMSTVRASVTESLDGNYLYLFSKSNIFIYPRDSVRDAVRKSSLQIEEVSVRHHKLNTIIVSVKEKNQQALVCSVLPDFDDGRLLFAGEEKCMFADEQGLLYKAASTSLALSFNRYYIPSLVEDAFSSLPNKELYATSTSEFHSLQKFYNGMKKAGIDVEAVLLKENGEYEAYVRNPGTIEDEGVVAVVYFNNSRPFESELENLVLFWNHALQDAKTRKEVPSYEYIDVRYGPNVFFRHIK